MMTCSGSGELVDEASEIRSYLGTTRSVNGNNVLAFSSRSSGTSIASRRAGGDDRWPLQRKAARHRMSRRQGEPIALDVASAPTFADAQAVVL